MSNDKPIVNRGSLFQAFTGRTSADVSGKSSDIRGMLTAVGGHSDKTRSGVNVAAAAKELGVHRSTVFRWLNKAEGGQGSTPRSQHMATLQKKSRQAATTQRGRRNTMKQARADLASGSRKVTIAGRGGFKRAGKNYTFVRTTSVDLDPQQVEAMLNAYEQGGEQGFAKWASKTWGGDDGDAFAEYLDGWQFEDIRDVEIK